MTNPNAAIRVLVTYALCIPLAMIVGWMITNPLDYGTLGFFGLIALLLASPFIIKWHYPLMIFALASPIYCFFLKGNPPFAQVAVMLSFGLAVIDRTLNSEHRFRSPAVMTWPIFYTIAMAYITAELTGGIGLHALGGDTGGGKKYIQLFIGCATFFALTSRYIPKHQRKYYVALYFLPGALQFISDMFPFLPSPLNYVNLLIPPSSMAGAGDVSVGVTRMGALGASAGVVANFMLARYGLRGILNGAHPGRCVLFFSLLVFTLVGGFRIVLVSYIMTLTLLFFIEGLHRTRLLLVAVIGLVMASALLVPFAKHLPYTFQRAMSFLPLNLDRAAVMDADGSKKWREDMWRDTWPKVPQYLLLGKGYALNALDFEMMGNGQFADGVATSMDRSLTALAISGDYHNGPLSTLMPFGIWGALSFLWISLVALYILYRNYRYGDPELKTVNTYFFVVFLESIFGYFFIFGAYSNYIGDIAKLVGFSIALNWGICAAKALPAAEPRSQPLPQPPSRPRPLPA